MFLLSTQVSINGVLHPLCVHTKWYDGPNSENLRPTYTHVDNHSIWTFSDFSVFLGKKDNAIQIKRESQIWHTNLLWVF